MNERKWWQPQFQLHLIIKSRTDRRQELALPTSFAVDIILENDAAYDVSIYSNFLWTAYLLNVSTFFSLSTDRLLFICCLSTERLLFIIFICSLYRSSATFKLLHHFGFVRSVHIFRTTDAKYVTFCVSWCKSVKDSAIDLFTPLFTCQYSGQKLSVIQGVCQ